VLLEEQDRTRWDRVQIDEGAALVDAALRAGGRPPGPYALQAAIAAVHAQAPTAPATDWRQIAALYGAACIQRRWWAFRAGGRDGGRVERGLAR
jgi:RNA polymerase sigma-70 factor (ECF subfamily)